MTVKRYNGRSWNAWNVSLWIGNDEPLYRLALDCIRRNPTRYHQARDFIDCIGGEGAKTPDGATFNLKCVREALIGLEA